MRNLLLITALISFNAHGSVAEWAETIKKNTSVNGYVYKQWNTDRTWKEEQDNLAVNIGHRFNDTFSLSSQVATKSEPLRRLELRGIFPISDSDALITRVGRVNRKFGFYNIMTTAPDTAGMTYLPNSIYDPDMLTATFMVIDGAEITWQHKFDDGSLFNLSGIFGQSWVESEHDMQMEAWKFYNPNIKFVSDKSDWGLAMSYKWNDTTFIAEHAWYDAHNERNKTADPTADYLMTKFADSELSVERIGLRQKLGDFTFTGEYAWTHTQAFNPQGVRQISKKSENWYLESRYSLTGNADVFFGYAAGKSSTPAKAHDQYTGFSYTWNDLTFIGEYHKGRGSAWNHYNQSGESQHELAGSITYRF